jgi:cytochrome c oxidase subunit II
MLTIGAVASVVGVAVALIINWFPTGASTQAHSIDTLYDVLLIVSIPVFVLVEVVVLFSVWKFRMRPGEELKDGPPIHGNTRLEIIWTAIPAILMVGLSGYAYGVLRHIEKNQPNAMKVQVTGQQFTWTFQYPQAGGKMISSPQLYLPKGKPVYFNIKARDVIHSFWVPAFLQKRDMIPGRTNYIRFTPTKEGTYDGKCAELCGEYHSEMLFRVKVVSESEFQAHLAQLRQDGNTGLLGEEYDRLPAKTETKYGERRGNHLQSALRDPHGSRSTQVQGTHRRQLDHLDRPQDHRVHVPDRVLRVLLLRRRDGAPDPRRAVRARNADPANQGTVQPAVHHARHRHAADVRDAAVRRIRQRHHAAPDRRTGRRVPATERPGLLVLPLRLEHRRFRLHHPSGCGLVRLVRVRATVQHHVQPGRGR